jgi:hypothetical protein
MTPFGSSTFREAYAHGINLILDYNEHYNNTDFTRPPQYLHMVIVSEEDAVGKVSKKDISALQNQLLVKMKESAFNHQTIFIPYYSESQMSELDSECATFVAQLGFYGKKRGVRSAKTMAGYISEKFEMFLNESANTKASEFMNNKGTKKRSYSMSSFASDDD